MVFEYIKAPLIFETLKTYKYASFLLWRRKKYNQILGMLRDFIFAAEAYLAIITIAMLATNNS